MTQVSRDGLALTLSSARTHAGRRLPGPALRSLATRHHSLVITLHEAISLLIRMVVGGSP
ncbi:hypothetical protein [Kibdelosporangium philippinense]|uniref:hypothetical protein n=1 Tax=Kibdelosporangium philippinense TaxID=211113 RepID=UPI003616F40E